MCVGAKQAPLAGLWSHMGAHLTCPRMCRAPWELPTRPCPANSCNLGHVCESKPAGLGEAGSQEPGGPVWLLVHLCPPSAPQGHSQPPSASSQGIWLACSSGYAVCPMGPWSFPFVDGSSEKWRKRPHQGSLVLGWGLPWKRNCPFAPGLCTFFCVRAGRDPRSLREGTRAGWGLSLFTCPCRAVPGGQGRLWPVSFRSRTVALLPRLPAQAGASQWHLQVSPGGTPGRQVGWGALGPRGAPCVTGPCPCMGVCLTGSGGGSRSSR